jgi:hypothetical protein
MTDSYQFRLAQEINKEILEYVPLDTASMLPSLLVINKMTGYGLNDQSLILTGNWELYSMYPIRLRGVVFGHGQNK